MHHVFQHGSSDLHQIGTARRKGKNEMSKRAAEVEIESATGSACELLAFVILCNNCIDIFALRRELAA